MKDKYFGAIGIFFILMGLTAIVNSIYNGKFEGVLWYCYVALIINGIGLIRRDSFLIMSQINIILIPFVFWNIDFFYHILAGKRLWGITEYYFSSRSLLDNVITFQHIFTLPVLFYSLYKVKIVREDPWKLSFAISIAVFALTRLFTSPVSNINCVYKACVPFINTGAFYPLVWIFGSFVTIMVANYIVISIFTRKERKYFAKTS